MQKLSTGLRWPSALRRFSLSASLMTLLFLYLLVNCSLVLVTQATSDVSAQEPALHAEQKPQLADEPAQAEATATATSAAAAPTAPPPPAPKPAPVYDKVSIPSIGLSSRYVPVGLTASNNIDVHATLVGMYARHGQLGQPGTVFLDGHNPGVFSKLPRISIGSVVTITTANGETFQYTVVHTETVQLAGIDMRKVLSPYGGASEALNLMTCVGAYNANTGTTDQRFVVYAVRS